MVWCMLVFLWLLCFPFLSSLWNDSINVIFVLLLEQNYNLDNREEEQERRLKGR
jgi:hypothetical protein